MRKAAMTTFLDTDVAIAELTVEQVINLLREEDERDPINIDLLLNMPGAAAIITASTGLPLERISEATPTDLENLLNEVMAVNPHWAGMAKRIKTEMERQLKVLQSALSEQPAS